MNRNILVGVIVATVLIAGGWWYLNQSGAPATSDTTQLPTAQDTNITTTPPSSNSASQNPSAGISQFTKTQVLNGYDQCGNQFKDGESTVALGAPCEGYVTLLADNILFADLDGDDVFEAIVPARIVLASSGGALYVFKNQNGTARVVATAVIGKENIEITSVTGNTIVGKTDGAMGYTPTTKTYKFVNGKLIEQ